MQVLGQRGLTSSEQGRGTFVRSLELGQAVFGLHQWSEQWSREATQVKLLEACSRAASESVARVLHAERGRGPCFCAVWSSATASLSRTTGNIAIRPPAPASGDATSHHLVRRAAAVGGGTGVVGRPAQDNRPHSLRSKRRGCSLSPEGAAVLCLEHLFSDASGTPISWGCFLCRADVSGWRPPLARSPCRGAEGGWPMDRVEALPRPSSRWTRCLALRLVGRIGGTPAPAGRRSSRPRTRPCRPSASGMNARSTSCPPSSSVGRYSSRWWRCPGTRGGGELVRGRSWARSCWGPWKATSTISVRTWRGPPSRGLGFEVRDIGVDVPSGPVCRGGPRL